ncbi:hypothetical protein NC651_007093 [Populus alba x Populus x berolinensis]|nr:hypothetical protein NC651_007093 [Populus alba x Populus x berolinensis]
MRSTDSYQQTKHVIGFGPIIASRVNAFSATGDVASDLNCSETNMIQEIKPLRDPFQITHTAAHSSPRDPDQSATQGRRIRERKRLSWAVIGGWETWVRECDRCCLKCHTALPIFWDCFLTGRFFFKRDKTTRN